MSASPPRGGARPNVLLVVSDDQGPWALGCAGNPEIRTPVLDALAADGTRLSRFFCTSPVCSPARASLLTGSIPSTHGVHDYLDGAHSGPASTDYLAGTPTLTDALADAGYRLGLSGKWHLGASDVPRRGFVHWFALDGGGSPYQGALMHRDGVPERVDGYLTDVIADDAADFLDDAAGHDDPFFLAVNFTAPHKPFAGQHPAEYTEPYRDCAFASCPQGDPHPWQPTVGGVPIGGEADTREALVGYFAAVTAMDAAIGRILARLDHHGLAGDTIVVFTSDNGFNCGHHGIWGKGNATRPQNMLDEHIRVPLVLAGPGVEKSARRSDFVDHTDTHHGLLALAGIGDATPFSAGREIQFCEYGTVRMARTPTHKIQVWTDGRPAQLFEVGAGKDETVEVTAEPGAERIVEDLSARVVAFFDAHSDPMRSGPPALAKGTFNYNQAWDRFTPPTPPGTPDTKARP
jgi:choline-sulfatase